MPAEWPPGTRSMPVSRQVTVFRLGSSASVRSGWPASESGASSVSDSAEDARLGGGRPARMRPRFPPFFPLLNG